MTILFFVMLSYVLGSIPFGVLVARMRGVDLRKMGSGNIGATNVLRSVGKAEALFTLGGDILKGTVSVLAVKLVGYKDPVPAIVGFCAVFGHNYSVFLRFRGGKGVATSLGVLFAYAPPVGLVTVALWLCTVFLFRYSSLGALTAFSFLPMNMIIFRKGTVGILFALALTGLMYIRHRDNIKRLLRGEEPKIGKK
jgi:glycerol-3-phosphate acyltransferase PlsY